MIKRLSTLFIAITASIHVLFFKIESLDFMTPKVLERFNLSSESAKYVEIWAFNQGFYNLFLALGLFYCIYKFYTKGIEKVVTLTYFLLVTIIAAAIVLLYSKPENYIGAMVQGIPALCSLIFFRLHLKEEKQ